MTKKKRPEEEQEEAIPDEPSEANILIDHDPEDFTKEEEASGPIKKIITIVFCLGFGSFLFLNVNALLFGSEGNLIENIFSAIGGRSWPANITGACIYTMILIGFVHLIVEDVHEPDLVGEVLKVLFLIGLMANEYFSGNPLLASVYLGWRDAFILILAFAVCVLVIGLYFLPTILATKPWLEGGNLHKRHPQFVPLAIVNLFFGASVIGWVVDSRM